MLAVEIILLIVSVIQYLRGKYILPVLIYAFFITNAFIFNIGSSSIKITDFALLEVVLCCIIGYSRDKSFFSIKRYPGAIIPCIFLFFYLVSFLYSVLNEVDTLNGIVTELRNKIGFLCYFAFRVVPKDILKKSIRCIFIIVILSSVFFVFQYFTGLHLVSTYVSEVDGNMRMQVTPPFIAIFSLFLILYGQKVKYRWIIFGIFVLVLLIAQNRTPIITLIMQVSVFMLLASNMKRKMSLIAGLLIIMPLINYVFEKRSEREESSILDVNVISYIKDHDYSGLSKNNTFLWRIAFIAERADYLLSHPDKILLGVGAIDENSKYNKFKFSVGTGIVQEDGTISYYQLRSGDLLWGPLLIKYGILGVFIYLYIMTKLGLMFFKEREHPEMMIGFLIIVGTFTSSFSSSGFLELSSQFNIALFLIIYENIKRVLYS